MIGLARPSSGFCGENRNQIALGLGWLRVLKFEPEFAAVRGQLGLNPREPTPNATLVVWLSLAGSILAISLSVCLAGSAGLTVSY
jgi:hypothetical protein